MTTTKTNSIYPISIQIKIQSNCLLIRHVIASYFYKIFFMNFCDHASSWSRSNKSTTQNKPTLAQLCLKTWSLYFSSGIQIIFIFLKWKLPRTAILCKKELVRYFCQVLSPLAKWKLQKLKLVKNMNFIKAIFPEGREKNQKFEFLKRILVEAETGYCVSARWWM